MPSIKWLLTVASCLGPVLAAPTATTQMNKRASANDAAFGFASLNGGTTGGGSGGTTTTVSSYAQFTAAVANDEPKVVVVGGPITQAAKAVKVGSNTSILGKDSKAVLTGFGLLVKKKKNVIIRNLGVKKVLAANGDAIAVQESTNVWIDHCDVSSDRDHDKDYYDGLLDVTHAADYVTISNTLIHDHWKASLVGHSDKNGAQDTGHLHITYANNHWANVNSRGPSIRFGTAHIYNNYFENVNHGVNTRDGAQVLVESNQFVGATKPLYSTDKGYAVAKDNDFGKGGGNQALAGTLTGVEYKYSLVGSGRLTI
ncbi:putative pectate lyase [Aspergillus ochraceoroseus]|uniref:pectate lyase n=1 Tax=Aspergillus ochraceoroseus TaxID=138278 RepID=A0A0F8UWH8_9EURO|nr:putative pectate lyase [Aspergillus ochraceoroseus]